MSWIVFVVVQVVFIVTGVRRERAAGLWSWSKFFFSLAFAAAEAALLIGPLTMLDMKSRCFAPVFGVAAVIAAANFIWFIIACRRWRLPDGRTSLEAWRDANQRDES